jgi:phytoene/squalene synthetase
MHSLLEPAPISRSVALERCWAHLYARSRLLRLASAFPRENREHLIAVLAFAAVLSEAAETPGPAARRRALKELADDLQSALASSPRSALGHCLSATVRLKELPAPTLLGPLEEIRTNVERKSFETRRRLHEHAQAIARPIGRALLRVVDRSSERNEVLMDALCTGFLLARWTTHFRAHWNLGRLQLPVEELARSGIALQAVDFAKPVPALRPVVADQVRWIRGYFHKGWPLCAELGPWRGRLMAFFLRWHAASLSALEARNFDVSRGVPPSGVFRFLACTGASLLTTRPPDLLV